MFATVGEWLGETYAKISIEQVQILFSYLTSKTYKTKGYKGTLNGPETYQNKILENWNLCSN